MIEFIRGWDAGSSGKEPLDLKAPAAELRGYALGLDAREQAIVLEEARASAEARAARGGPVTPGAALAIKAFVERGGLRK